MLRLVQNVAGGDFHRIHLLFLEELGDFVLRRAAAWVKMLLRNLDLLAFAAIAAHPSVSRLRSIHRSVEIVAFLVEQLTDSLIASLTEVVLKMASDLASRRNHIWINARFLLNGFDPGKRLRLCKVPFLLCFHRLAARVG